MSTSVFEKQIVRMNLGDYPATRALKAKEIESDAIELRFSGLRAVWNEFEAMIRQLKYDCSEMSLVSFLQAKARGVPVVLLPVVVTGWAQHGHIGYNSDRGVIAPKDLEGKRVGIRSITQTSGTWARSILQNEHGVDLDSIRWVCVEEPHVADYDVPANVDYDRSGRTLADVLLAGEIDASILGPDMYKDSRIKTVIPDAAAAIERWHRRHGITQIVHMPIVTEALARHHPEAVREVFRLYMASRAAASAEEQAAFARHPAGLSRLRHGLELMIEACMQQKLLPRRLTVEELFDDTTIGLGEER
jgi:4,5-dihydroxyphthalate decarboxylase